MKKILFFSSLLLLVSFAGRAQSIAGTVFEDINYGGGAGRSMQDANAVLAGSAVGVSGATVELYNASTKAYITKTTTGTAGTYTFANLTAGRSYIVRVVNNTVRSTRPGSTASLVPVQTFVVSNGNGDVNRVGGEAPDQVDAGTNTTRALNTIVAQSQAVVAVDTRTISGVDFGFNFDVITNTNDSGQGSLRQFLLNANALTNNAALRQVGRAPRRETSIFMISDGLAHPGLRAGLADKLTSGANGVALLNLSTVLPSVTDAATVLDGTTQTTNVGNTNPTLLGTGGTVGTSNLTLDKINGPEVELSMPKNTGTAVVMLTLSGDSSVIRGLAVHGSYTNVQMSGRGVLLEGNALGTSATAVANPGTTATGNTILVLSAPTGVLRNNLIGYAGNSGVNYSAGAGTTGFVMRDNELLQNGQLVAGGDNITVGDNAAAGPLLIEGNLITLGNSSGIQLEIGSISDNIIRNNSITANGTSGFATRLEGSGIHYLARNNSVNSSNTDLITLNVIANNQSSGVVVNYGQKKVRISQNSIYANGNGTTGGQGLLSIDFTGPNGYVGGDANYGQGDGVTANDGLLNILGTLVTSIPPYRQGDGGIDYPIITSITKLAGTNTLRVQGYVGTLLSLGKFAGATIEVFSANNADTNQDGPTFLGDLVNVAHGEAQYYIGSVTADATGNFDGLITNPAHTIDVGDNITATAYLPEFGTSECGINQISTFAVSPLPVVLTSFSAVARGANAELSWTTASEINNAYFTVERSADGQQFAAIGQVAGQGSTTATHAYAFLDVQPLPAGGTCYYRLRQVDTDGTGTYSPVRPVALAGLGAGPALYPSPATTDAVTLDLTTVPLGDYTVTVGDLTGRQLRQLTLPGGQAHQLLLDQPAGVYLLTVRGLGQTFTQRLVKK